MKILYILPYLSSGGTEKHVLDLVSGFAGEDDLFLLAPPGEILDRFRQHRLSYHPFPRLDKNPVSGLRSFFQALKEITRKNRIELIHVHGAPELIFFLRWVVKDIPVLFTVHGFVGSFNSWGYWLSSRICNHYASRVIVVSEAERKLMLKKGIRRDIIHTIHNGIPDPLRNTFSKPPVLERIPEEDTVIGAIARLEAPKGINYLVTAFADLLETNTRLQLVIVGSGGREEELKRQVERLGIERRVTFTGYRNNVHDFMHHFDILVIPSLYEAISLVLLEGAAHGRAIIAANVGGIPEVISDGENGIIIPPGNPKEIARALKKLINDRQLQKRLGESARKTYQKGFTVERMLSQTRTLYRSITEYNQ